LKVLVIGGGGREHAMALCASRSPLVSQVFCAPGNAGTATLGENLPIAADSIDRLVKVADERKIDLTIVGCEEPLCLGIVDRFQACGLRIFGPTKEAARIEGDKIYARTLMGEARIPMPRARTFSEYTAAREYIATRDTPQVVKMAGLYGGKGSIICDDPADALLVAELALVGGQYGTAGNRIVVQEKLVGTEASVHALVDGKSIYVLATARDYKRSGDGDTGVNTGGMGAYSPSPMADDAMGRIESEVLVPMVDNLRRNGIEYRGVLYCGLMLTPGGPQVLEFNCRFGDPEAQVLLARLRTDFIEMVNACVDGCLDELNIEWDPRPAVCVVKASGGYPGDYKTGKLISGLDTTLPADVSVHQAGTRRTQAGIVSNGGRVLAVTALGETLADARSKAYEAAGGIDFTGASCRSDIASDAR
jgi:phosphoribosylamine---glycine ligase